MVNNIDFSKRLQQILDYYGLSMAAFAEEIGVQRSSISHILSGRNKPSLDVGRKILSSFEEVDMYWLLNGKGSFPSSKIVPSSEQNTIANSSATKEIDRIVIFYKDGTFKNYHN